MLWLSCESGREEREDAVHAVVGQVKIDTSREEEAKKLLFAETLPVLDVLHKAVLEAMESPQVIDAFNKNQMRRIPHKTLEEGQAWLAEEMNAWRKITSEIPIEMAE